MTIQIIDKFLDGDHQPRNLYYKELTLRIPFNFGRESLMNSDYSDCHPLKINKYYETEMILRFYICNGKVYTQSSIAFCIVIISTLVYTNWQLATFYR